MLAANISKAKSLLRLLSQALSVSRASSSSSTSPPSISGEEKVDNQERLHVNWEYDEETQRSDRINTFTDFSLTRKQSDFFSFDPNFIDQEPEDELQTFKDFAKVFGEHRFARPPPKVFSGNIDDYKHLDLWKEPETDFKKRIGLIPPIPVKDHYPSGFVPPKVKPGTYTYHVRRTVNHMLPVYLRINARTNVVATVVRRVDGNLFALRDELDEFLYKRYQMEFISQVAEVYGRVKYRGDFEVDFKEFLIEKGF